MTKTLTRLVRQCEGLDLEEALKLAYKKGVADANKKKEKIKAATSLWVKNRANYLGYILSRTVGEEITTVHVRRYLKKMNMLDMPNVRACMGNLFTELKRRGRLVKTGKSAFVVHKKGHRRQCNVWLIVR